MIVNPEILACYIPSSIIDETNCLIKEHRLFIKLSKKRLSKLGDYRSPKCSDVHIITINKDLHVYLFLITFLHEVAHMLVRIEYKSYVKAHGAHWKKIYSQLMQMALEKKIFPEELSMVIRQQFKSPKASSFSCLPLARALKLYVNKEKESLCLEEIPLGSSFELASGKRFVVQQKLRRRFQCKSLDNNKQYSLHPLVEVNLLS